MSDRTSAPPQRFADLERVADELRADIDRRQDGAA